MPCPLPGSSRTRGSSNDQAKKLFSFSIPNTLRIDDDEFPALLSVIETRWLLSLWHDALSSMSRSDRMRSTQLVSRACSIRTVLRQTLKTYKPEYTMHVWCL